MLSVLTNKMKQQQQNKQTTQKKSQKNIRTVLQVVGMCSALAVEMVSQVYRYVHAHPGVYIECALCFGIPVIPR